MKKTALLTLIFGLFAISAQANSLEIGFNDFSFQLRYDHVISDDGYGRSLVDTRLLYNDNKDTLLGSMGFDFVGQPGNVPGLELGAGARIYAGGSANDTELLALGVGGITSYAPPFLRGFGLSGELFYCPQIFSFLDADRMLEFEFRTFFAITPKIKVFLGFQNIDTDFDRGDRDIDRAIRGGFDARF